MTALERLNSLLVCVLFVRSTFILGLKPKTPLIILSQYLLDFFLSTSLLPIHFRDEKRELDAGIFVICFEGGGSQLIWAVSVAPSFLRRFSRHFISCPKITRSKREIQRDSDRS